METTDIFKLIPHRYPFLLVDRIIDMDGDSSTMPRRQVPYACIILRLRSRR